MNPWAELSLAISMELFFVTMVIGAGIFLVSRPVRPAFDAPWDGYRGRRRRVVDRGDAVAAQALRLALLALLMMALWIGFHRNHGTEPHPTPTPTAEVTR